MFRMRDLILVAVTVAGMAVGVIWPGFSGFFTPAVLWFMMALLFMAFLNMDYKALTRVDRASLGEVALWTFLKLLALPLLGWALAAWLAPAWALPMLVLAGVSSGVTAPFFAGHLGADVGQVLKNVMLTSLLVPLTLPLLVSLLMGGRMEISTAAMSWMLAKVIFIPLIAAWLVKRFTPAVAKGVGRVSFPLSLAIFFLNNLGIFSQYSDFLKTNAHQLLFALLVACLVALSFGLAAGLAGLLSRGRYSPLSGAVSMVYVNNVLGIVFGGSFFGPQTPLLSAVYMAPLFCMVIPLRLMGNWLKTRGRVSGK